MLEIDASSSKFIYTWKKKFQNKYTKLKYLKDIPHVTLISTNVQKSKSGLSKLKNFLKQIESKLIIEIDKPDIFYNDKLASGNTYYYMFKKNINLQKLQKKIANFIISNFKLLQNKRIDNLNLIEKKNLQKYGFPYVGANWIPHVTVCTVQDKNTNKLLNSDFLKSRYNYKIQTSNISIYNLKLDKLILIHRDI